MKAIVTEGRSVNWKGRIYLPGEEVKDLPKDEAKRLRLKGAIRLESPKKAPKKKDITESVREYAEKNEGKKKENAPDQKSAEKPEGDNA